MTDAINPNHYRRGSVECIDAIESATVDKRGIEAVCTANVLKYLWRYEAKNGLEDVKKARWYLERLIVALEAQRRPPVGTPVEWPEDDGGFCDPRTVVGVDVSFDTERHLSFAPTQCADCGFPVRGLPEAHCKHHYASASNE